MQLRDYRKRFGLTLKQVASQMGISLAHVGRHERGDAMPNVEQIEAYRKITEGAVRFDDWLELRRSLTAPATSRAEETTDA